MWKFYIEWTVVTHDVMLVTPWFFLRVMDHAQLWDRTAFASGIVLAWGRMPLIEGQRMFRYAFERYWNVVCFYDLMNLRHDLPSSLPYTTP